MKIFFTKGVKLAFLTAIISGLAIFFNKFAVTKNIDPYQFTMLKNVLVAVILCLIVITPLMFKKLRNISRNNWVKLIGVGIVGGSLPFLLFFKGLSIATPIMAGFLHKTLFIWVAVLAVIFLKEKITKLQYIALGVLLLGNALVGGLASLKFGYAELLILLATLLWSVENIIAKKVLQDVDAKIVAWARMFFGSIILLGFVMATSGAKAVFTLNASQWGWIFLSVGFLTIYVLTWYKALKYEKASTVASVLVLASPLTTLLNSIYKGAAVDPKGYVGILLSVVAVALFVHVSNHLDRKRLEQNEQQA